MIRSWLVIGLALAAVAACEVSSFGQTAAGQSRSGVIVAAKIPKPEQVYLAKEYRLYLQTSKRGNNSESYVRDNASVRFKDWLQDAKMGSPIAEHFVSLSYYFGIGTPKSIALSAKWDLLSANHGNTSAMDDIGYDYYIGEGVPKDAALGLKWQQRAADSGDGHAMQNVGFTYLEDLKNFPEAMRWFLKASDAGYARSMRAIGTMYARGQGFKRDPVEAAKWYRKAADAGNYHAAGLLLGDRIAPAFKSYTAQDSTEQVKTAAVKSVRDSLADYKALDMEAAEAVLESNDIKTMDDGLSGEAPLNPMQMLHREMLDCYIARYLRADSSVRSEFIGNYSSLTATLLEKWYKDAKYADVAELWTKSYDGVQLTAFADGDKETLVRGSNCAVNSLLKIKKIKQGKQVLLETLALCDKILADRPWDYYLRNACMNLCFKSATSLSEAGDTEQVQPLLRRAWSTAFKREGEEAMLDRYPQLPLEGKVPDGASTQDAEFFKSFVPGISTRNGTMQRFTIPTDFDGTKYPFDVYVVRGPNAMKELEDQFRWVKEYRGGIIPQETINAFREVHDTSVKYKSDFRAECLYNLSNDPEIHLQYMHYYASKKDYENGLREARWALRLCKPAQMAGVLVNIGWYEYLTGHVEDCIKTSRSALAKDSTVLAAQLNIALSFATLDDWPNAKKEYDVALKTATKQYIEVGITDIQDAVKKRSTPALEMALSYLKDAGSKVK